MECHHPAGEGEDNGDNLLNLVYLEATNPKVEEKAHLVINCAGNEGDSVEKMAGNVPKVSGNVPKEGGNVPKVRGNVSKEVEIFQR